MASKKKAKKQSRKTRKPRVVARIKVVGIVKGRFVSKREVLLKDAIDSTISNTTHGDPFPQHQLAADLKARFWSAFNLAGHRDGGIDQLRETTLGTESAHGEAINMIFTKLSHIASCPTAIVRKDTYTNLAAYIAIAFEVAKKTQERFESARK